VDKKLSPSTLAVDPELRSQVRDVARQHGLTTLELTNLFINFALENCEIEMRAPIVKYRQRPLPLHLTSEIPMPLASETTAK
jgi:hypothetical protein